MSNGLDPAYSPGRKRLALFLDGTRNTVDDNTNVWRLKALCAPCDSDGVRQVAYYNVGVGTMRTERVRGGALGFGIERNVSRAYEWLVENYNPGDEIFIFGLRASNKTGFSALGRYGETAPSRWPVGRNRTAAAA